MRNRRLRLVRLCAVVAALTCFVLLLPSLPLDGSGLLAQDGPVQPPGFGQPPDLGPAPTSIPDPNPAPTRGRRQVQRRPTPTPEPSAIAATDGQALAASGNGSNVQIGGERLVKVIGNRLSHVLYGQTDSNALYRSEDSGSTWQLMTSNATEDDFIVSPANPLVLYTGQGINCDAAIADTQPFLRSGDGGVTWTQLPIGDNLVPLLAHPQEANTLLAADCTKPYVSADGGERWTPKWDFSENTLWRRYRVDAVAGATQVGELPATRANWHYLYAGGTDADGSSVVAYTGDEGENWTRITPRISPEPRNLTTLLADPTTPGRLWFADENGIWHTDDFGASWLLGKAGLERVFDETSGSSVTSLALGSNGIVFVGTPDGLYHGDGISGEWMPVDDEVLRDADVEDLLLLPGEPSVLWVTGADGAYRYEVP